MTQKKTIAPGFTFIELVVAVLILALLGTVGGIAYQRILQDAKVRTTKANLKILKSAISMFHMEHNRYPSSLKDLVERPKGDLGKNWRQYMERIPQDGWDRDFYYKITASGKHPYELYSYGSGGPEGLPEDQISVWQEDRAGAKE